MLAMLASHPHPVPDVEESAVAAEALHACAAHCAACADACLAEDTVAELRACIRRDLDCADICAATARVVARQTAGDTSMFSGLLAAAIEACERCAEECETHAAHHEHCRICAEVCRDCAAACRRLMESIVPPM
ncbi:MAG TPA: hypothetical protein VHK88_10850 [Aquihabitans sp.]|jgi:hypothetical protein|nr:hypothetical protein [Aquihabitans sp.]